MTPFEVIVEWVIFLSYLVISLLVLDIFIRHRNYFNTNENKVFMVSMGLFLMFCGFTHIYSSFNSDKSIILSSMCALVSMVSAICFVMRHKELDNYLSLRITTIHAIRDDLVHDLSAGYDLQGLFSRSHMLEGCIQGSSIREPLEFFGDLEHKSIITINNHHYRIANVLAKTVSINSGNYISVDDDPETSRYRVFGYDATADIHMSHEKERINQMKMEMCMSTAHDVKTPLTSLGVVISCLKSFVDITEDNNEYTRLLDEAYVNMEMINLIITQFMEVGCMDTNREIRPAISSIDMALLKDRIVTTGTRIKGEKVKFECLSDDGVPSLLFTDGDWIWQIILNLLSNSAKYTYDGYIHVSLDYIHDKFLVIIVKDTGIGIKDEDKQHIFEKFVTKKTFGHESHGIGLYSVKTKVNSLNGKIDVSDNPVGGSVFKVIIPVAVDTVLNIDQLPTKFQKKRCLVVDDTPSIRKMMTRLLRDHFVETACNGVEGLQLMQASEFDLVLIDMCMPVMDGLECVKRFREWESKHRHTRQKIFCMSANQYSLDQNFDGKIPKPIDSGRLSHLLQEL